jgi:hypothetical protein
MAEGGTGTGGEEGEEEDATNVSSQNSRVTVARGDAASVSSSGGDKSGGGDGRIGRLPPLNNFHIQGVNKWLLMFV